MHNSLRVLLVEDNPADLYLLQKALIRANPACCIHIVQDGDSAIEYLSENRPDLIVLDLNIPRRDGGEVLQYIRATSDLANIAVTICSSSPTEISIREAPQADCYLEKPSQLEEFLKIGETILTCYSTKARLTNMTSG